MLGVSCAGFYAWRFRPPSARAVRHAWLTDLIREVHTGSYGNYGAKRVHAELVLGRGITVGHNAVAMLMQRAGIAGRNGARTRSVPGAPTADDLVDRIFIRDRPNQLWVTDITEHPTREGKVYGLWHGRWVSVSATSVGITSTLLGTVRLRPSGASPHTRACHNPPPGEWEVAVGGLDWYSSESMSVAHDPRQELNEAIERTLREESARFEISMEIAPGTPDEAGYPGLFRSLREDGVLPFLMLSFITVLGVIARFSKMGRRARKQERDWTPEAAQGVVDFAGWRAATDFGYRATIEAEGKEWGGFHGERVAAIESRSPLATGPLWLLSLLRGAIEVTPDGEEVVNGVGCRRFSVRADLGAAAALSKFDLAVPPVKGFSALSQLPASASIDPDGLLRRLRFDYQQRASQAITFVEFKIPEEPDWTRLPRFRSPTCRPYFAPAAKRTG